MKATYLATRERKKGIYICNVCVSVFNYFSIVCVCAVPVCFTHTDFCTNTYTHTRCHDQPLNYGSLKQTQIATNCGHLHHI